MGAAGQDVGYIRVSTVDQSTARQLDGVHLDKTFEEKISGKSMDRPKLKECLAYLREGDTLHVHEISRLARSMTDLRNIVDGLAARGVTVVFHKENMRFDGGTETSTGRLLFNIMAAFAEFERDLIRERQAEGIAKAKAAGVYAGHGGQFKLTKEEGAELRRLHGEGVTVAALCRRFKITRPTAYRYLKAGTDEKKQGAAQA